MMNMLAIGLILTTIVTAGVWSPSPSPPPHHDDDHQVIVKEGHRVVVVEYDKEVDGSTKVLISPHDVDSNDASAGEENAHAGTGSKRTFSGPKELVCDAYGKCKHKLANALGKTKDAVKETAHEVSDKAHEIEQQAIDAASGVLGKAKEAGKDVGETKDKLSEEVSGSIVGDSIGKAKDAMAHGIGKAKKVTEDVVSTVKDEGVSKVKNFDVVDSTKRMGEDIEGNVTGKVEEGVEKAKESVQEVGDKSFGEILSKLKEVSYDVLWYMVSRDKIDAIAGLIHMLGFSTAYGMCVWVTFVSSYILGRYLPRTQFGMVQSRIYPVYFKAMAYCVSAALLGHVVSRRKEIWSNMMEMFPGLCLFSALLMVLTNMVFLEPRATKLMYERLKIGEEEGRGTAAAVKDTVDNNAGCGTTTVMRSQTKTVSERQDVLRLNEKLKRLNTYSSALNVSTLVVLTWHMAYLGQQLQATR